MKILSIGNSFSQDAQRYLYRLAEKNRIELHNVNLYIAGCSLERHVRNINDDAEAYSYEVHGEHGQRSISIKEALLSDEWDYVTLQEVSTRSYAIDGFKEHLGTVRDYVKQYAKDAKILLHKTWGYPEDYLGGRFPTTEDMYSRIERVYKEASNLIHADGISPSGEVLLRLMKKGYRVHRDTHASYKLGRYALALTWLEYLSGIDARELLDISLDECDESVPEGAIATAKECVHEAILSKDSFYCCGSY